MAPSKTFMLAALMLAPSALALPTGDDMCPLDALPLNVTAGGCTKLERRWEGESKIFVADGRIQTWAWFPPRDYPDGVPTAPPAFTYLWDNVIEASCNPSRCGKDIGTVSTAPWSPNMGDRKIIMWLEGIFWTEEIRDEMVGLMRQAFDRAVVRSTGNIDYADDKAYKDEVEEWGPRDIDAITSERDHLRVVLRSGQEEEEGCGDIISRINAFGGLFHPIFGFVEAVCSSAS